MERIRVLIFIEVGAVFTYFIVGLLGHYAQIYRKLPISEFLSFQIAQGLFIFGVQSLLISLVYLKWKSDYKKIPSIHGLLAKEENDRLEFKSSFRWDLKESKVNKAIEKSVMKTIAAFLNSHGGHLVIGVDDNRNIIGVEKDLASLPKANHDGFENHFTHIFHNMIGPTFRQYINLVSVDVDGKNCCIVSVSPSSSPVYLRSDDKNEEFYIRTGNGTTSLRLSEVGKYIRNRFRSS